MSSSPTFRPDPFSQPFFPTAGSSAPRAEQRPRRRPLFLYLIVTLVVLGGAAYLVTPLLVANAYYSSALESYANRKESEAIGQLDSALAWHPDNPAIRALRCRFLAQSGNVAKAKEDLAAIDVLYGQGKDENLSETLLQLRAQMRQNCGEYRKAMDDMRRAKELSEKSSGGASNGAMALNNLAYFGSLAVAFEPLDKAKDEATLKEMLALADRALKLAPEESSLLDTRGYVYYVMGDQTAAIADFDKALAASLAQIAKGREQIKGKSREAFQMQIQLREMEFSAAVMLQHRMKAHQKAGNDEAAKKEREEIVKLGFNPELPLN